jgi:flagellar basal-body rod protein FlgB
MRIAMDPTRSTPVALAERRLAWLEARQRVLSQNIAHADTPGYRPEDLRPFARLLATGALSGAAVPVARTDERHLSPTRGGGDPRAIADRRLVERSPNGNGVALDEQALKVADTDGAHALATALHRRYLGLFRTALGRQQ